MLVLDQLIQSIRSAATHNPDVQVAPACILWPDGDRQWETVIPRLQVDMPELLQLGDFAPDKRIGPAIWLRCVIAGTHQPERVSVRLPSGVLPELETDAGGTEPGSNAQRLINRVPILYLPGVSRQDLRAIESCPEALKPLAELQYRGVIWSQVNAKDWTILAFLKSNQGGLGLDVAQDADSKHAMQLSLFRVLDEELQMLKGKHLDKDYFNTLLSGGDPIRDLLQWLDQGDGFKAGRDENTWRGFVEVCKSMLGIDPEKDGPLKAASLLAQHKGPWNSVWGRFCEAPRRYATVPTLIRKTAMPLDFFEDKTGWPQWNEQRETLLRHLLIDAAKLPPHEARVKILALEKEESPRCDTVWSELGESPLANALVKVAIVANITEHSLAAGRPADMAKAYESFGWKADDAALKAMACVQTQDDIKAISSVLQTIYLPWVDDAARLG